MQDRPTASTRTMDIKMVGTSHVQRHLCILQRALSTVVRKTVTKTVPREPTVETRSKVVQLTITAQLCLHVQTAPGLWVTINHPQLCLVKVLLYVHTNIKLIRDGSPGRPPRLSHSSWALTTLFVAYILPCTLSRQCHPHRLCTVMRTDVGPFWTLLVLTYCHLYYYYLWTGTLHRQISALLFPLSLSFQIISVIVTNLIVQEGVCSVRPYSLFKTIY